MTRGLTLEDVTVAAGSHLLLDGVTLTVAPGELVVLVGPNGAGKTTLLRSALGVTRPTSGRVTLAGHPVGRLSSRRRAAEIAWLPQDPLPPDALTVLEVATAARYRFDETWPASRAAARAVLARVQMDGYAARPLRELSGGERQRVALAVALAQEAPLLLLDEPASHLDPAHQLDVYGLVGTLWREGRGILCVTHDLNLVRFAAPGAAADTVAVVGIAAGRLRFRHALSAPALVPALEDLFGVRMTAVADRGERLLMVSGARPS